MLVTLIGSVQAPSTLLWSPLPCLSFVACFFIGLWLVLMVQAAHEIRDEMDIVHGHVALPFMFIYCH